MDLKPRDRVTPALRELHWLHSRLEDPVQVVLAGSFTSRFWDTRRNISRTFCHQLPKFRVDLHCALHRVATSACRGHVDELATEPFLLLHREHGTGCMKQATDGAETAVIDGLVSS